MIVAEYSQQQQKQSMVEMLAYGHRGYISYSEDELCKLFDKIFTEQQAFAAEKRLEFAEEIKNSNGSKWRIQGIEKELEAFEAIIAKFQAIADQVFEERFLL